MKWFEDYVNLKVFLRVRIRLVYVLYVEVLDLIFRVYRCVLNKLFDNEDFKSNLFYILRYVKYLIGLIWRINGV